MVLIYKETCGDLARLLEQLELHIKRVAELPSWAASLSFALEIQAVWRARSLFELKRDLIQHQ